jgi:hypothetical protein
MFGRLVHPPYANGNYGIVIFGIFEPGFGPETRHNFIVPANYASSFYIDEHGNDLAWWESVAVEHLIGVWCEYYEVLWQDVPILRHKLPSGEILHYGLGQTRNPETGEYLWYVAVGEPHWTEYRQIEYPHVFLVDELACQPEFMNRMGADPTRWARDCWEHPAAGEDPRTHAWGLGHAFKPTYDHSFWIDEQREKREADFSMPISPQAQLYRRLKLQLRRFKRSWRRKF